MAQPLYFLPDVTPAALVGPDGTLSRALLRSRGLDEQFSDVRSNRLDCATSEVAGLGPGGKSGVILCYQSPETDLPSRVGYHPDQQTWHAIRDGQYWIGLSSAAPPTPADLRRPGRMHGGYTIQTDHGDWLVPIIRRPDETTELPRDLYQDPRTGELLEPLKEAYRAYWDETGEVITWLALDRPAGDGPRRVDIPKPRALELAVRALGLNYRFTQAEQSILRVVDMQNYLLILGMSVDLPKFLQVEELAREKKTAPTSDPADPSTTPGPPADSPPTDPPAAISTSSR